MCDHSSSGNKLPNITLGIFLRRVQYHEKPQNLNFCLNLEQFGRGKKGKKESLQSVQVLLYALFLDVTIFINLKNKCVFKYRPAI